MCTPVTIDFNLFLSHKMFEEKTISIYVECSMYGIYTYICVCVHVCAIVKTIKLKVKKCVC